jgi:hypothetical protein
MNELVTLLPWLARVRRLPLSRDQVMLLIAAINEIFLGVDTYLAHSLSGTIRPGEWIPIIFGPVSGVLLLLAGLIALRRRGLAQVLATAVFVASIVVGGLGVYFHVVRTILPGGPAGEQVSLDLFFWAPPVLGPLAFALVGVLGLSAAWVESPPDSGTLALLGGLRLHLPYSKTQAYCFMVALGTLIALISSVLDHARTRFENPWLWLPVAVGVFATVIAVLLGAADHPTRADVLTYVGAMALLILVGGIGALLHVDVNLIGRSTLIPERFLRGAPFMAPLLFANMGMIGLIVLLDPSESPYRIFREGEASG